MAAGFSSGVEVGGRWLLGGQLGQGAFGQVFRADDTSTLNLGAAAVKVLHPSTSPKEREAFHEEIRKVVSLRHPNLVAYLDSGEHRDDDGQAHLFLVTELCRYSLQAYLASGPGHLTADQGERLLADMAAGLGYLHSRGLLHRDLKPANVLLGGDDWKLGDFGLTRAMSATGHYHHGTVVMGTPRYMAPELFEDGAASAASDVYAVGVTLHQALTGRTVHEGSDVALLVQVTTTPPKIDRDLPPHWRRLIERCLERDPADRPGASQLPAVLAESRLKPSTRLAQLSGTSPLARHLGQPLPPPPASARSLHPSAPAAPAPPTLTPGSPSPSAAPPTLTPGSSAASAAAPPTFTPGSSAASSASASAAPPAGGAGASAPAGAPTSDDAGLDFGVPSAAWAAGPAPAPPPATPAERLGAPNPAEAPQAGAGGPAADVPAPAGSGAGLGSFAGTPAVANATAPMAGELSPPATGQPLESGDRPAGAPIATPATPAPAVPNPAAGGAGGGGGGGAGGGTRLALIGALAAVALLLVGVAAFVAVRRGGDERASDTTTGGASAATGPADTVAPQPAAAQPDAASEAALRVAAVVAGPSDAPAGFDVEDTTSRPPVELCPGVTRAKVSEKALASRSYNFDKAGQLIVPVAYVYAGAPEAEAAFAAAQAVLAACDGKDLGPDNPGRSWAMTPVNDVTIEGAVQTSATLMQIEGGPGAGPTVVDAALAIYTRIDDVLVYAAGTDRASVIWYAQLMVARVNEEVPPPKVEPVGDVGTAEPGPPSEVRLAAADPAAGVSAEVTEWLAGHPNTDLDTVARTGCEALGPVTAPDGVAAALQQAWDDLAIDVRSPMAAADHAQLMAVIAPRYCPDEATRLGIGQP